MRTRSRRHWNAGLAAIAAAVVLLVAGCAEKSPAVAAGNGPAGKVVEISGSVTAEREGAKRTLTIDETIYANDEIVTGSDSAIVVVLDHNGARWTLGANESRVVSAAAAWRAPKGQGDGTSKRDVSEAAGRHAEREGFDTAATARAGGPAGDDSEAPGDGLDNAAPPSAIPSAEPASTRPSAPSRPASVPETAPATGPSGMSKGDVRQPGGSSGRGGYASDEGAMATAAGDGASTPKQPAPPPPPGGSPTGTSAEAVPAPSDRFSNSDDAVAPIEATEPRRPAAGGSTDDATASVVAWSLAISTASGGSAAQNVAVRSAVTARRAALVACVAGLPVARSPLKITVAAGIKDGRMNVTTAAVTVPGLKDTTVATCLGKALTRIKPAGVTTGQRFTFSLLFEVDAP